MVTLCVPDEYVWVLLGGILNHQECHIVRAIVSGKWIRARWICRHLNHRIRHDETVHLNIIRNLVNRQVTTDVHVSGDIECSVIYDNVSVFEDGDIGTVWCVASGDERLSHDDVRRVRVSSHTDEIRLGRIDREHLTHFDDVASQECGRGYISSHRDDITVFETHE